MLKTRKKTGRPRVLDGELGLIVADALGHGLCPREVAEIMMVSLVTVRRLVRRYGRVTSPRIEELRRAVRDRERFGDEEGDQKSRSWHRDPSRFRQGSTRNSDA